mgnify:CR=1 FL=1
MIFPEIPSISRAEQDRQSDVLQISAKWVQSSLPSGDQDPGIFMLVIQWWIRFTLRTLKRYITWSRSSPIEDFFFQRTSHIQSLSFLHSQNQHLQPPLLRHRDRSCQNAFINLRRHYLPSARLRARTSCLWIPKCSTSIQGSRYEHQYASPPPSLSHLLYPANCRDIQSRASSQLTTTCWRHQNHRCWSSLYRTK